MTEKELEQLEREQTELLFKEIDENYSNLDLPIERPNYNNKGELTNEKEVRKSLKLVLPILLVLWNKNIETTTSRSIVIMRSTNALYNFIKRNLKTPKNTITTSRWNNIMNKIISDRQKKVKIKQVIRGNARVLNKRVQNTVLQMYKDGKNYKQTAKELQKQFNYNKGKAKSIAITEKNYYKSEAQLQATRDLNIKKTWIHTGRGQEARPDHLAANGNEVVGRKEKFQIGGKSTVAPQHFGIPSEDINCHCIMRIDVIDE